MKTFGLLGFPLTHSFSAIYFNARFSALGLRNYNYKLFSLKSLDKLEGLICKKKNLTGFNVTIPLKINILKYLDYIHPIAGHIGAVNTVMIKRYLNGIRLLGYNTDWYGFEKSLILSWGKFFNAVPGILTKKHSDETLKAMILGTGGSARAAAFAFAKLGISYSFISRKPKNKKILSYSDINKRFIHEHRLIVNATPVGMYPEINNCPPLPYKFITRKHLVFDLVYNPEQTTFLSNALSQGAQIKNGFEMLLFQAEKAWEIWKSV